MKRLVCLLFFTLSMHSAESSEKARNPWVTDANHAYEDKTDEIYPLALFERLKPLDALKRETTFTQRFRQNTQRETVDLIFVEDVSPADCQNIKMLYEKQVSLFLHNVQCDEYRGILTENCLKALRERHSLNS